MFARPTGPEPPHSTDARSRTHCHRSTGTGPRAHVSTGGKRTLAEKGPFQSQVDMPSSTSRASE
eukprot:1549907-Amphidinium_carterae.2